MKTYQEKYIKAGNLLAKLNGSEVFNIISMIVESLPAEEVAPVKRGRWQADGRTFYRCTRCNKSTASLSRYCRYCGSDNGTDK